MRCASLIAAIIPGVGVCDGKPTLRKDRPTKENTTRVRFLPRSSYPVMLTSQKALRRKIRAAARESRSD